MSTRQDQAHGLNAVGHASALRARLERGAAFVTQLHRLSTKSPNSWRRAESVGRDVGLADADLETAIRDAEKADLIQRRADDAGLIMLTAAGRAAASR
jgi:hypothetical protein